MSDSHDAPAKQTNTHPLDHELRELLRAAVERDGLIPTAKRLRASRNLVLQALSGLRIYPGSAALLRAGLVGEPHRDSRVTRDRAGAP